MIISLLQNIVGFFAGLVSISQMFSGVFLCRAIQQKGSTKGISPTPFIGGLFISLLLLQQSRIIQNTTMTIVNVIGSALSIGYLAFYYNWTKGKERKELIKNVKLSLGAVFLLILYSMLENAEKVEHRYGIIVSLVILTFVAAPFRLIPEVIKKKNAEDLPYPMILMGLVVSLHWVLYSILIWNKLLFIQNAVAALFCLIQISFFAIYPDNSTETPKRRVKSK